MKQWYLTIDTARCENCGNCLLACKDEHVGNDWPGYAAPQPGLGQQWIRVGAVERGRHPMVDVAYLPMPCMHCENAACIEAARDGAVYRRTDGIVVIDPLKAKGQRQLVAACPYGAVSWNEELDVPQKCTMCAHLLDAGWEKTRCVQACPTGALSLTHLEPSEVPALVASGALEAYRPELNASPHVYYRNLFRFTRCFLGGSVAVRVNGREECAEDARVTLRRGAGEKVGECLTDTYGDFKFDNLERNSGRYRIDVDWADHEVQTLEIDLKESLYVGTIYLEAGRDRPQST